MVVLTKHCLEQGHVCYGSSFPNGLELHLAGSSEAAASRLLSVG